MPRDPAYKVRTMRARFCIAGASFLAVALAMAPHGRAAGADDEHSLMQQAEQARGAGRLAEAASLYTRAAGAAAALDVAPVRGGCSVAIEREHRHEPGVSSRELCHKAFVLGGTAEDLRNEATSMLAPNANTSLEDLAIAVLDSEAAAHAAPREPWGALVHCEIARRLGSVDGLEACRKDLARIAPTALLPLSTSWSGPSSRRRCSCGSAAGSCCSF